MSTSSESERGARSAGRTTEKSSPGSDPCTDRFLWGIVAVPELFGWHLVGRPPGARWRERWMAVGGSSMAVNEPVPLPQLKSLDRGPASAAYDFRLDAGLVIRRAIEIAHPVDDLRRARDRTHGRDEIAAIGGHSPCLRLDCRFPRYFRGLRDSALGRFERKSRQTTSARGRPQSDPRLIESPCRLHGAFLLHDVAPATFSLAPTVRFVHPVSVFMCRNDCFFGVDFRALPTGAGAEGVCPSRDLSLGDLACSLWTPG